MIASGPGATADKAEGIAKMASLYSSAQNSGNRDYPAKLLAAEHVAVQNADDVPAVNMSNVFLPPVGGVLDGGSLASLGIDEFAVRHDTLYVVGVDNDGGNLQVPADSYNVLGVAAAKRVTGETKYRQVLTPPAIAADGRRLTHLIAPGDNIWVPETTPNGAGVYAPDTGTSFAAPHATATAALLVQDARARGLGSAAVQEVQKAILINSADKVEGRLRDPMGVGMDRTVLKRDGTNWDNSDARDDPLTNNVWGRIRPLDDEMGFGFLNAKRAATQLRGGKFSPDTKAGTIGWDYRSIVGEGTIKKYKLSRLKGDSWISITLTWDREVELDDRNRNGRYDVGESFINPRLSDLDLYLMPANARNIGQNKWSSNSATYNVETIFFHLDPNDADYEIWVRQGNNIDTSYALAWWAEPATAAPGGAAIKGRAWQDDDGNGLQGPGEHGLLAGGFQADLYTSSGSLVASAPVDAGGLYQFPSVAPGSYYVHFGFITRPEAQYNYTLPNVGPDDAIDSDVDRSGYTDLITLSYNEDRLHVDAGLIEAASVGDYTWLDVNHDGIQDGGDLTAPYVAVSLYEQDGTLVSVTTSDLGGHYQFTGLYPGTYYLQFHPPADTGFTYDGQGDSDALDSDAAAGGRTRDFTLAAGEYNDRLDAGLVPVPESPNANDDSATTVMNSPVAIYVLANDTDPQNDPLAIIDITPPEHGSAALRDNGTPDDTTDDYIVYTPATDYIGSDQFTYTITDGDGHYDTATVTVQVYGPGPPPGGDGPMRASGGSLADVGPSANLFRTSVEDPAAAILLAAEGPRPAPAALEPKGSLPPATEGLRHELALDAFFSPHLPLKTLEPEQRAEAAAVDVFALLGEQGFPSPDRYDWQLRLDV